MLKNFWNLTKIQLSKFKSSNLKGIFNVIGSIIIYMVFGSLYTWSNINVYLVSYLKQYNSPNIEIVDGFFIMPIVLVISNFSNYFGTTIEEKLGFKKCLFLTLLMACGSHFILIFTTRLVAIYFLMIIFGIAIGFSYIGITKNAWYYYPEKKGLISGIILFGYGGSSMIFSGFADSIINPNNESTDSNGLFNKEIADNTYIYIKKLNIILFIMSLIGFLLISDYNKNNTEHQNDFTKNDENRSLVIKEVFKTRQVWQIIILNFCSLYFLYIITNTNRSFGQLNLLSSGLLSTLSKLYSFINGFGRIIWGYLLDKFKLKKIDFFILFLEIIISSTIFYAGKYQYLYFIMICCCSSLFSGVVVITVVIFPKIYGIKYSNKIFGIASAISGFSCILGPIASKVFIKELKDYKKMYISGMFFSLLAIINLYFLNDNKYIYSFEHTKNNNFIFDNEKKQDDNQFKEMEFKEYDTNYEYNNQKI